MTPKNDKARCGNTGPVGDLASHFTKDRSTPEESRTAYAVRSMGQAPPHLERVG